MTRRVLHVVGRMHRAGIETWLMEAVRRLEGLPIRHDFLVHARAASAYDAELLQRGCRIYRVQGARRSPTYPAALDEAFRLALRDGPVDVLHAHEQLWCGFILEAAARARVATRIAHSHNDTLRLERFPHLHRAAFGAWMRRKIARWMTRGLACSEVAAPSLFGPSWREDPRVSIHYYGLDFTRFRAAGDSGLLRRELGIPAGRTIIGHVGRCEPQKNQLFLLRVFREALRVAPELHLLFVGEGALEPDLRRHIDEACLSDRVTWLRNRPDIPQLMVSAMDAFLLPSLHEGLPLVLLEAQAAGLPCLFSSEITPEANIFPETNAVLTWRRTTWDWVDRLVRLLRLPRADYHERVARLSSSPFSVAHGANFLAGLYGVFACAPDPRKEEVYS